MIRETVEPNPQAKGCTLVLSSVSVSVSVEVKVNLNEALCADLLLAMLPARFLSGGICQIRASPGSTTLRRQC